MLQRSLERTRVKRSVSPATRNAKKPSTATVLPATQNLVQFQTTMSSEVEIATEFSATQSYAVETVVESVTTQNKSQSPIHSLLPKVTISSVDETLAELANMETVENTDARLVNMEPTETLNTDKNNNSAAQTLFNSMTRVLELPDQPLDLVEDVWLDTTLNSTESTMSLPVEETEESCSRTTGLRYCTTTLPDVPSSAENGPADESAGSLYCPDSSDYSSDEGRAFYFRHRH